MQHGPTRAEHEHGAEPAAALALQVEGRFGMASGPCIAGGRGSGSFCSEPVEFVTHFDSVW